MKKTTRTEVFLWSIALPGFGQLLNGRYVKGLLLVALEFVINWQADLNEVIILSFHGDIKQAIQLADYHWLMFYPCVYMFGIWDAYKDAGGGVTPFAVVPFASGAFFATTGLIFSRDFLGPMWLAIIGLVVGVVVGMLIRMFLARRLRY
ncbi:membrane protein [Gordoniibacillus kamchatkensis]|uniref:Membrane protein n=2 Tax=Gordoniibacillus kamchatkensis TaxID=1590651 RepID=A0ABR5AMS8_9BACL|nr:hypothetical protein [Paenibacillus sp. VKM B-2647]KIL42173.1 membrane protein [Paenibacillus sp. VKM B-2647]